MANPNTQGQPFFDHLDELRQRLMRCVWVFLIASGIAYTVRHPILEFLKAPLFAVLPPDKQHLYFTGMFESFFNHLTISMIGGAFIGAPFYAYQLWAFISPGLHYHEKKYVWPFVLAATTFFFGGAAFAYYLVLPAGFKFFVEFGAPQDVPMITVKEYFSILFRLLFLFGASFEFPVILVFLAQLGLVGSVGLRAQRRNVIIGIAVVSALFAPPDVMSMLFMMAPLYLFYEMAILVISMMEKRKNPPKAAI
jgi:sec-independent protein translocase protein TatC